MSPGGAWAWASPSKLALSGLLAPIEEGHIFFAMMHLADASYRLGRTLNCNPEAQEVIPENL
jgi:hypothetical protein